MNYMLEWAQLYEDALIFGHTHPGHEPTQQVIKTADEDVI